MEWIMIGGAYFWLCWLIMTTKWKVQDIEKKLDKLIQKHKKG